MAGKAWRAHATRSGALIGTLRRASLQFRFRSRTRIGHRRPRAVAHASNHIARGSMPRNSSANANEVVMRVSGSSTGFGHLSRLQAPVPFHPEPGVDVRRPVQSPDEPFFANRTEPNRTAPSEVSFGPFRLLPTQFLLLEGDKPVSL